MDLLERLFSGRINRRTFLNSIIVLSISEALLVYFLSRIALLNVPFNSGLTYLRYIIFNFPVNPVNYIFFPLLLALVLRLSFTVRRLHDLGKPGWYSLLMFIPGLNYIVLIYLLIKKGKEEGNKYGEKPSKKIIFPSINISRLFLIIPILIASFIVFFVVSMFMKYDIFPLTSPFKYFLSTPTSIVTPVPVRINTSTSTSSTSKPITEPTLSPITSWQTYNHDFYSLTYPNLVNVYESNTNQLGYDIIIGVGYQHSVIDSKNFPLLAIEVRYLNPKGSTIDKFIADKANVVTEKVGNKVGKSITQKPTSINNSYFKYLYVQLDNDKYVLIMIYNPATPRNLRYQSVVKQILDSIQFK